MRYGLPRSSADAAPRRRDRTAGDSSDLAQSVRTKKQTATYPDRHDAADGCTYRHPSDLVSTGPKNIRRTAVQQPHRASSLSRLRATCGRTPEVSGVGAGKTHRMYGLELGAPPSGQPRPPHRLVCGSAAAQHPLRCLQHEVSDSALGSSAASGVAHSRPDSELVIA